MREKRDKLAWERKVRIEKPVTKKYKREDEWDEVPFVTITAS